MPVFKKTLSSFLICLSFLLSSCLSKVVVELEQKKPTTTPSLVWNYTNLTVMPGEEVPFQLDGTAPYVTNANGIGTFDSTSLIYTAPVNRTAITHTISATDSLNVSGSNTFKIAAFQHTRTVKYPLSFGDENFPTSSAVTANGDLFVSAIVADSPGWERWVIYKSTDIGTSWNIVDQFIGYEEGDSQPLSLEAKNNDLYACGYMYGGSIYNSEWIIRKTSNGGSSWSISDHYAVNLTYDHVCSDITHDPTTGHLFAVGYDEDLTGRRGIVRESSDDGATWNTIGVITGITDLVSVKVSPLGVIWTMAEDGVLYKGTYSLGSWLWTSAGTLNHAPINRGIYELRGDLELINETTALYSYTHFINPDPTWYIDKTTDGGTSWSTTYTGAARSRGQDIKKLSTGELVSIGDHDGNIFPNVPYKMVIVKSTDNGATWNTTLADNTPSKEAVTLIEANDNSVLGFGQLQSKSYQMTSVRSTDSGSSWAAPTTIYFKQSLYSEYKDFTVDRLGVYWASGYVSYIDNNLTHPWVLMKSTDLGATWTASDVFTDPVKDYQSESIAIGPANEIYVSGHSGTDCLLRKSTDNGATWNQVDVHTAPGTSYVYGVMTAVASNGDVYYGGSLDKNPGSVTVLRKGSANGTVWSTLATFPIAAGSSQFSIKSLKTFSDGSLWLSGNEKNAALANQAVIYKSTDGGTTFTEVYRATNKVVDQIIRQSNGDIYASDGVNIIKSTDNGASWNDYYLGATLGNAKDFLFDSNGKIFIVTSNDKVITKNQFDNSFFVTFNFDTLTSYSFRQINDIKNCGSLSEICLIGHYDKSIDGAVISLIPIVVP